MYTTNMPGFSMNRYFRVFIIFALLIVCTIVSSDVLSASETSAPLSVPVPVLTCRIVNSFPHDSQAFTQGLVFKDGFMYEGTGIRGRSGVRKTEPGTGGVLQSQSLPEQFFGEGITIYKNRLIQLTWRSRTGFIYDWKTFRLIGKFSYNTEGWGITHNGKSLIVSDGSAHLYFWDPDTYRETGRITVHDAKGPVAGLNELEYINGEIYGNVWRTTRIARIHPASGRVTAWIELEKLSHLSGGDNTVKTLNGIAYDAENGRLFVTGKLWPSMYEIELVPLEH